MYMYRCDSSDSYIYYNMDMGDRHDPVEIHQKYIPEVNIHVNT
jgi:hypothetical protein